MKHIISTLRDDTRYTGSRDVVVKGSWTGGPWVRGVRQTPAVRTEVSDEDAEFLANHGIFQLHQKGGFVKIEEIVRDPPLQCES